MPKDKKGRTYTIKSKKGKDGKMHKYPSYGGGGGGKKASKKGGGGGGGSGRMPNKNGKRQSLTVIFVAGGGGLTLADELGAPYAAEIMETAMSLATMVPGIDDAWDVAKVIGGLRLAASPKAANIPLVGGIVAMVGQEWRNFLADFNLRP